MGRLGPTRYFGAALLAMLAGLAVGACSSSSSGGDGGSNGTGATNGTGGTSATGGSAGNGGDNPCLQAGNPACSTAPLDEFGSGTVEVFFSEQRVEAITGFAAFSAKGGGDAASFGVSAFEEVVNCSTNQPGDAFSDARCVSYSIESFIEAPVGEWFVLYFIEAATANMAPVTMRVISGTGGSYTLEVTWGMFDCVDGGNGTGEQVCFDDTPGPPPGEQRGRDECCTTNAHCVSNRCCTGPEICDFEELDNKYTCRDAI